MSMESSVPRMFAQAPGSAFGPFSVGMGKGSVCEHSEADEKEEMNIKDV